LLWLLGVSLVVSQKSRWSAANSAHKEQQLKVLFWTQTYEWKPSLYFGL